MVGRYLHPSKSGSGAAGSRTRRGTTAEPPFTSRAVIVAICSGVHRTKPWPIPVMSVSPFCQASPRVACFHSRVGSNHGSRAVIGCPVSHRDQTGGPCRRSVDANPLGHFIEIDIAALLQRTDHIKIAVAVFFPTMEAGITELHMPWTEDLGIRRRDIRFECRETNQHFEG